jgi:hypothetical protein
VRLVFARPPYADVPLWNASDVRGKVVAIMRGPGSGRTGDPGDPVPFSVKVFHAQEAGAVGVIFMDNTRNASLFEKLPRIDEGPLPAAFNPDGSLHLKVEIPCAMILSKHMGLIQEGALHCIHFAPQPSDANKGGQGQPAQLAEVAALPFGWRFAVVLVFFEPQLVLCRLSLLRALACCMTV